MKIINAISMATFLVSFTQPTQAVEIVEPEARTVLTRHTALQVVASELITYLIADLSGIAWGYLGYTAGRDEKETIFGNSAFVINEYTAGNLDFCFLHLKFNRQNRRMTRDLEGIYQVLILHDGRDNPNFSWASFEDFYFDYCDLENIKFWGTDFQGVTFTANTFLENLDFKGADLSGSELLAEVTDDVSFENALVNNASLDEANTGPAYRNLLTQGQKDSLATHPIIEEDDAISDDE